MAVLGSLGPGIPPGVQELTTMTRPRLFTALALGVALSALTACGSDAAKTADTTATTAPATSEASTTAPATTEPATTAAATTTTVAQTTTQPAPTGPTVTSLSTPNKNLTCAEATSAGSLTVSWKAVNAASVIIGVDSPGEFATGPATGSYSNIPANCNDTQVVYITPVAADGTKGTPKKITITIGA